MDEGKNRRKFIRIEFSAETKFLINEEGMNDARLTLINISLKGILAKQAKDSDIPIGTIGTIQIKLKGSDTEIIANAELIHKKNDMLGFYFKSLELEDMIHLRRLLELNYSNDIEIAKEISFLIEE